MSFKSMSVEVLLQLSPSWTQDFCRTPTQTAQRRELIVLSLCLSQSSDPNRREGNKAWLKGEQVKRERERDLGEEGEQFVDEVLPQVLKHQMEKQLNQVQENRLVISPRRRRLGFFIKTLTKVRKTSEGEGWWKRWLQLVKDELKFKEVSWIRDSALKSRA